MYQFNEDDAERFAYHIRIKHRKRGGQLELEHCPYCRANDKWTFGMSLATGQFECKRASCGARGNMITLSRDFDFSLGKENDAYYNTVDYAKKNYKKFRDAHKHIETRPAAVEYLQSRGISEAITNKYEITTKPDDDKTLVFPFKNENGELEFIKYRNTNAAKGKSKEWCEKDCKPILFGMNHCSGNDCLIITEGQIDSLSVAEAGFENAVSVPIGCNGFTWIPYCYDFVSKFKQIIVMGDCENGKITLVDEISKRWPAKVKAVKVDDYRNCKDANDILRQFGAEAIRNAIKNAEPVGVSCNKLLSQVKQIDIMNTEMISTGLTELDKVLDGGFRMGQLAVLTGRRGEGKSTLASMWGVRALDQGYNSYFYSGELPDFFFRNWMDCQVTGKSNHTESENDALNKWYGDRAYIYDNTNVQSDEIADILKAVELAIVQSNCRFILIDNLMTALEDDLSTDLYRKQSLFVGNLASLAKKYNVFILLIAHPRKTLGKIENDSISGSSNITDKADITLMYGKADEKSEDKSDTLRFLSVQKNRLTGKLTPEDKPIQMTYDPNSRRVADDTKSLFEIRFNWNDGFVYAEDDEIPF